MSYADNMKQELHYYDIYPKVFPKGKEIEITLKPLGHHAKLQDPENAELVIYGIHDGHAENYPVRNNCAVEKYEYDDESGTIVFKHTFPSEQQYFVRLCDKKNDGKKIFQMSVYAVDDDLCGRYPFIGDLHMHTCRSDGRQAPEIVCANYRKHGYDFFAITDHNRYYPSLEAINAYKDVPIEFNIVPGEEVHIPKHNDLKNDIHIVNFGGNYSINGLVREEAQIKERGEGREFRSYNGADCPDVMDIEEFQQKVMELAETLDIPEGIEKFTYACCTLIFNEIRKAGGLGIYAHPYWIMNDSFHVPENLNQYILKTKPFDAFEVLGGETYYEQNGLQTQLYYQNRADGIKYPIVGSTDSHNSIDKDVAYVASTMVFSPANEKDELIASIKDYYSVAIDGISDEFRLVGDLRLTKYACFLLKEYFPLHDDLCYEEGRAMKDYVCGVEGGKETIEFLSGRMKKQREKYFKF